MIQPIQLKAIHALLRNLDMQEQKKALVYSFSEFRTESSGALTYAEAGALITYLKSQEPGHKMRRKIIRMAHEMGWKLPGKSAIDMAAVNAWCEKFGYAKKPLNAHTLAELPKLVTQFEAVYKSYLKAV